MRWSEEETKKLKDCYLNGYTSAELMEIFPKFNKRRINSKIYNLGLTQLKKSTHKATKWSKNEEDILIKHYLKGEKRTKIIEFLPNRTLGQISSKIYHLNLVQKKKYGVEDKKTTPIWTKEEENILIKHYISGKSINEILYLLPNKDRNQVNQRVFALCLYKKRKI